MANDTRFTLNGTVIDILKGGVFKVKLDDNDIICDCNIAGKMRMNNIRVIVGDKVQVDMSPYDLTKGRIIYRNK